MVGSKILLEFCACKPFRKTPKYRINIESTLGVLLLFRKPVDHTATPSEDESNCFYCLNGLFALFQIRTGLSSAKLFPLEELFYKHGKNEKENRLLSRREKIKIVA